MMKKLMSVFLLGLLLILAAGCGGSSEEEKNSSPKAMETFSLAGVEGTIDGEDIEVTVPYGTNVTDSAATFTYTGAKVVVGEAEQESGVTTNDFTNSVLYTVVGDDNSTKDYTVKVTIAPSSDKAITSFSLAGANGTINGQTIAVKLPSDTNVTNLAATFTTTGTEVKVGDVVQISGQTLNNFTNPVVYTVTAADASTQIYTVTVTLETVIQKATAIRVSISPDNTGTVVPYGVFCARSKSFVATVTVTDPDGNTIVDWEWLDTDRSGTVKSRGTGTTTITEINGTKKISLSPPFYTAHKITFKATADDGVTGSFTTPEIA